MVKYSATVAAIAIASLVGIQGCNSTPTPNPSPTPIVSPDDDSESKEEKKAENNETPPQNRVKVFFSNPEKGQGDLGYVEPVWRRTDSVAVGAFALSELIKGPTSQEQDSGLESALSLTGNSTCGGDDFQLAIEDKIAKLQLCREVKSAGIGDDARAENAIKETLNQFSTVSNVVILNPKGDCFGDMSGENRCFGQLPNQVDNETPLALTQFGPIEIGMTVPEATQAAGIPFTQQASGGEEYGCLYYNLEPQVEGVAFMVVDDRIVRIDVTGGDIETLSGAGIGTTEAEIRQMYPDRLESEEHPYDPEGKYLIYVPKSAKNSNYRVIFETDGSGTVQRFRSGQLPDVLAIEGCV